MTPRATPGARCTHCGHDAPGGRFCSECGRPLADAATSVGDTAERPRVDEGPTVVPETSPWGTAATSQHPPAARFPLYADQIGGVGGTERPEPEPEPEPVLPVVPLTEPAQPHAARGRRAGGVLPWLAGAAFVLLLAGLGAFLLLGGPGGDGEDATAADAAATQPPNDATTPTPTPTSPAPTTAPTTAPPVQPVDVTGTAAVTASQTAAPGVDVRGDPVRFDAANMLDADPGTAWRAPGDGQGVDITVALPRPTVITRLGLINGYAKTDDGYDGYAANRRLTSVEWVLDDGTVVPQTLGETTAVQSVDVGGIETSSLTLRLLGTTAPGKQDGRDFTAISDLQITGDPR